jgi:CRP-like cAMP-binding protein
MYLGKPTAKNRRDNMPPQKLDSAFIPAIPWNWIQRLKPPIGGAAFRVALYIWFQKGVTRTSKNLVITSTGLNRFCKMDVRTFSRALHELEDVGMISVERQVGKSPRVTIIL